LDIDAMQHLVEQQPVDAARHPAQSQRRRLPELCDGTDAGAPEPLLPALADAVDILLSSDTRNWTLCDIKNWTP
jgi:hypothetical protein